MAPLKMRIVCRLQIRSLLACGGGALFGQAHAAAAVPVPPWTSAPALGGWLVLHRVPPWPPPPSVAASPLPHARAVCAERREGSIPTPTLVKTGSSPPPPPHTPNTPTHLQRLSDFKPPKLVAQRRLLSVCLQHSLPVELNHSLLLTLELLSKATLRLQQPLGRSVTPQHSV